MNNCVKTNKMNIKDQFKQGKIETRNAKKKVWYTFIDLYATEVDERGSDDVFRSAGIFILKNGKEEKHQGVLLNQSGSCRN